MKFFVYSAEVTSLEVDLDRCPKCGADLERPRALCATSSLEVADRALQNGICVSRRHYPQVFRCGRCSEVLAEGTVVGPRPAVPVAPAESSHVAALQERIGELEAARKSMGDQLAQWREEGLLTSLDPAQALRDLAAQLQAAERRLLELEGA